MKAKFVCSIISIALTSIVGIANAQSPIPSSLKKPNILVIMGDDIGWFNPSFYNSGVMGYDSDIHGVEAKHVPSVNNIFQIVERSGQARLFCRQ